MLGLPARFGREGMLGLERVLAPLVWGEYRFPGTDRALRVLTLRFSSHFPTPKALGVMTQLRWGPPLSPAFEGTFE
uniref:Uncharacterized protein n=1 Tax=Ursus americanus TaxID=9643 RepID=A0A452SQT6_URSAM